MFQLREPSGLVDLGELSVDVEALPDQLDLADRRRFLSNLLLDLSPTLLPRVPPPRRHFRRPQRRQVGGNRVGLRPPRSAFRRFA
jgi:hypothetical protein